jgi:DNA-binding beta-propeller fold protein YncE
VIEGQATLLARTTHDMAVDSLHDEIVASNAFAEAILFFRGGASGEEKPIRMIQGPDTLLEDPDNIALDPIHGEVFVAIHSKNAILAFPREGSGNVRPVRILQGPRTKLNGPARLAVDPVNNLLVVTTRPGGILIFDRTGQGDVAPRAIIEGPNTGMSNEYSPSRVALYPEGKKIVVAVSGKHTRVGVDGGFVAVWKYSDEGNLAPWAILKGSPTTRLRHPFGGVALNPEAKEIMVLENTQPSGLLVYRLPEIFRTP